MRAVLLLSDTISNRYLIKRFMENFDVVGLVIQEEMPESLLQKLLKIGGLINIITHIYLRILTQRSYLQGRCLEKRYFSVNGRPYPLPKDIPLIKVTNINETKVHNFIINLTPDIVVVSGTQLLREPILSLQPSFIKKGIVNMHTGLAPYIRGGNATFWALYTKKPQYIGATVYYVDKSIDGGDIILSARPDNIEADDTDLTIDVKARYLGIGIYIKALEQIEKGVNKRVKQWPVGELFAFRTGYRKTLSMIYELRKKLKNEKILKKYLDNKEQYDKEVVTVG